jgi:Raf kinase inhibitor-like YbhB/YbcL family protein
MRIQYTLLFIITVLLITSCVKNPGQELQDETQKPILETEEVQAPVEVTGMQIISDNFKNRGDIPLEFTCQGKDISPHLAWTEIPQGTRSFALSITDPDAYGRTWVHWLVMNIPANVTEFPKGAHAGIQVPNDFVKPGYGGPCPPTGKHRYFFTLYALDVEELGTGVNLLNFFDKVDTHMIAKAELVGMYQKK